MGKGDRKSKKGKIFRGSFGNSRPNWQKRKKAKREKTGQQNKRR